MQLRRTIVLRTVVMTVAAGTAIAACGAPATDLAAQSAPAAAPAPEASTGPTTNARTTALPSAPAPRASTSPTRRAARPAATPTRRAARPTPTRAAPAAPAPVAAAPAGLRAGNPAGRVPVPAEGRPVDTRRATTVIGRGTPAGCTSRAVVAAVAKGGIIRFNCGPRPVRIVMAATAKVVNANGPRIVIDGGGKVTLSGGGKRRILYMNTCDAAQGFTTPHCQDQDHPQLTVQNLIFADGNSTGQMQEGGGGGAIFVRGGRLKVVNSRFIRNRCDATGPDLGGAAIRVLSQYRGLPVYVVNSTFGGTAAYGGKCSNGGALSSIGVSWVILNSLFTHNSAIGRGANPAQAGTPGGGSGGALYADGNRFTVRIAGTVIRGNRAAEGGGAVFFVSNDRTGTMRIERSTLVGNPSGKFETQGLPGIFFLGASRPQIVASTLR